MSGRMADRQRIVPAVFGFLGALFAVLLAGWPGVVTYVVGVFIGGWVPFYLMPWLQSGGRSDG